MNDAMFAQFMTDLWGGGDPNADLWEIALLDDDPEPAVIDPAMEALVARDIAAAGDLLGRPPFEEDVFPTSVPGTWHPFAADPQTEREDRTADDHDEATRDWNGTVEDTLAGRAYRDAHPFPIDLTDADGEDF